ncbi:MAG: membrane protein insertase YidC [Deltaproteobacteria bacterium]
MSNNKLNYIIFLVLSFAIIFGYTYFFSKPANQQQKQNGRQAAEQSTPAPATTSPAFTNDFNESPASNNNTIHSSPEGELVSIDTPLYHGVLDTAGGRIFKWELKKYKQNTNGSAPINLFFDSPPGFSTLLRLQGYEVPELIPFKYSGDRNVSVEDGSKELVFEWSSPGGITVKKFYEIDSSNYVLKQRFEVTNPGDTPVQEKLDIRWYGKVEQHGRGGNTKSFITLVSSDVERVEKQPDETRNYRGVIEWFGYSEKYFMSTFLPETGAETTISLSPLDQEGLVRALYSYPADTIPAGKTSIKNWEVYLGPLESEDVNVAGYNLEEAINYGWVGFLARPLLEFLKWLNEFFHNYGISIIVITVLIRLVFLPLTIRSMVSMKQMQVKMEKVKPKMEALKEKYKDDKAKQNSELMKLYSSHGINPLSSLGGCFPLLLQLPVFVALYDVLLHSIELRHSSFLWINDLSEPETLFDIPGIGIPFRILPLLMGVSWFISQKMTPMTPAAGGENMQLQMKLMQFMPIIFTVMFWGLPSGLILYWTVSNILSIGQQIYVNRRVIAPKGG